MPRQEEDFSTQAARFTIRLIIGSIIALIGGTIGAVVFFKRHNERTAELDLLIPQTPPITFSNPISPFGLKLCLILFLGVGSAYFFSYSRDTTVGLLFLLGLIGAILLIALLPLVQAGQTPPDSIPAETPKPEDETATAPLVPSLLKMSTSFTLTLPKDTKWDVHQSLGFMERLLVTLDGIQFRIVATTDSIQWQIVDLYGRDTSAVEEVIRADYPNVQITAESLETEKRAYPFYRYLACYGQANDFFMPTKYITDVKVDPLAAFTQVMNDLKANERVVFTVTVIGQLVEANKQGWLNITRSTVNPLQFLTAGGMMNAAAKKIYREERVEEYVPQIQQVFEEKLSQRLYQTNITLQFDTPDEERLSRIGVIDGQLVAGFAHLPYNAIVWVQEAKNPPLVEVTNPEEDFTSSATGMIYQLATDRDLRELRRATRIVLEPRELALLWHLPHNECVASRIVWLSGRESPVSAIVSGKTEGIYIGDGLHSGRREPVYLNPTDRRSHINIIGKTGVGKSTLMHHMIAQDIKAGYGVAVIDPHGALVNAILENSIPSSREDDVVILDLNDHETPPPLNPLRGGLGHTRVGHIISIIERLFPDTSQYARLSRYLRVSLLTLQEDQSATIRDIPKLFTDRAYRERLLENTVNDDVLITWEEFSMMKEGEQRIIMEPILSRLSPFYSNPYLYPIVCHPDTLDFRGYIRDNKILLISLKMDEEQVPEAERDLIGAMLLSRLQVSGMQDGTHPYYIYIDEVQKFVTTSLDVMFSEARKFGLSLTVAHQYLGQLPENTLDAILGNVGASIMFACSPTDARRFAAHIRPEFTPDDLVNLDKYKTVTKMQYNGKTQPAFTLFPVAPDAQKTNASSRAGYLRHTSRKNHTPKTTEDVKAWLKERYKRPKKPAPDNQTQHYDV